MRARDIAGSAYWEGVWQSASTVAEPVNPRDTKLENYVNRRLHAEVLEPLFAVPDAAKRSVVEVGCANSAWLPYFASEFGWKVHGLDYSEMGCRQARQVLACAGLEGTILHGNVFAPPAEMKEAFDAVVSFGVVEHFADTQEVIRAFARLLRPGGTIVTLVPNMVGAVGLLQKWLSRSVYERHVPLDVAALRRAHELNGLCVDSCRYFLSTAFSVANVHDLDASLWSTKAKTFLRANLGRVSKAVWALEMAGHLELPAIRLLAPYLVCVARKGSPTPDRLEPHPRAGAAQPLAPPP
jgi:2-polyprenyl-3-methyl-5-hydroxy-6-metoxy-1,4-benzoquinol methylase